MTVRWTLKSHHHHSRQLSDAQDEGATKKRHAKVVEHAKEEEDCLGQ